jgi:DNA-binding response OmpR family regulator
MKKAILAIDTNLFTLYHIKQVMEAAGYKLLTALDGERGLEQFYNRQPALVILEIMLPHLDGWELCRRIRAVSNVPIIVHTALESSGHLLKALEVGASDIVIKPIAPQMLQVRVEMLLKQQAQNEQLQSGHLPPVLSQLLMS